MANKPIKVESIDHLISLVGDGRDFFISFGCARSSKYITYDGEKFWVLNYIDDSEQVLTKEQMDDEEYTNIGKAIRNGCFYAE